MRECSGGKPVRGLKGKGRKPCGGKRKLHHRPIMILR